MKDGKAAKLKQMRHVNIPILTSDKNCYTISRNEL